MSLDLQKTSMEAERKSDAPDAPPCVSTAETNLLGTQRDSAAANTPALSAKITYLPTINLSLEDVTVNGNEEMIRRAVNLVLDNAIKYAESGEIALSLRREGKWAVIEESNAASFEKGEHNELFERFYRPDTSRNTATGGHGVGLSVVKSILEAHGGSATAESDGKNIVFRLALPN